MTLSNKKVYKAINFDLDTKKLEQFYPNSNINYAYTELKNFFLKNNFTHRQGSGYISNNMLTDTNISELTIKLTHKFPWLSQCIKEFDVTNIGETFSLKKTIEITSKVKLEPLKKNKEKSNSLTNRLTKAKQQTNKLNTKTSKKIGLEKENLL